MIIWLFVILWLLAFGGVVFCAAKYDGKDKERYGGISGVSWVVGIIASIALMILGIATILLAGDTAKMDAFYNSNIGVYQTTITDTQAILTVTQATDNASIPVQGSVERIGVGGMTAERIKELRDAATAYNGQLAYYQIIKNNVWMSILFPEIPKGLKYITVK
jgi:hypothetical protein